MPSSPVTSYSLFVKKSCPTCELIEPVAKKLSELLGNRLLIYVQDDMSFLKEIEQRYNDIELEQSYRQKVEIVPTLIRHGEEAQRIVGWDKQQWQEFTGISELGAQLIDFKPGCGSLTEEPGMAEELAAKFSSQKLKARRIQLADAEDEMEACFDRDWSDGLPVIPPTPVRVMRMLAGTELEAGDLIGVVPPDNIPCNVEKVAINAVMAGCKPEYFPTVIAVVRAALQDRFCMHGLLCTTYFSSPVVIVNGPESRHIGMNSGGNALGQGNRANATIGRALQLLIRNVGGGKPGGIDRATLGNPGKYTFCFAEDESDDAWPTLAMDQGHQRKDSVVSLFAGDGVQPILDQVSRTPDSLAKSMAASLRSVVHVKKFGMADAVLVVCPEHRRVLRTNGWNKEDLLQAIHDELVTPGADLVSGVGGIKEGMPDRLKDKLLSKFRDDGLHIVTAGGTAGMFSAIISGWVASGERGSQLVSQRIQ